MRQALYDLIDGKGSNKNIKPNEDGFYDLYQLMNTVELNNLGPTSRDIVDCINETNKYLMKEFRMIMERDINNVEKYLIKTKYCPGSTSYTVCRL